VRERGRGPRAWYGGGEGWGRHGEGRAGAAASSLGL
jgi:hypothetical protein